MMITTPQIQSRADEILEARDPSLVGKYRLQIPYRQPIATGKLVPGSVVRDMTDAEFRVVNVELGHKLLDPPIPVLNLLVEKTPS